MDPDDDLPILRVSAPPRQADWMRGVRGARRLDFSPAAPGPDLAQRRRPQASLHGPAARRGAPARCASCRRQGACRATDRVRREGRRDAPSAHRARWRREGRFEGAPSTGPTDQCGGGRSRSHGFTRSTSFGFRSCRPKTRSELRPQGLRAAPSMSQVERDLGRKIEWAAVNHFDTGHPHAHIVVRGVDRDGHELRFEQKLHRQWHAAGERRRSRRRNLGCATKF